MVSIIGLNLRGTGFMLTVVILLCHVFSASSQSEIKPDEPCYNVIYNDTGHFSSTGYEGFYPANWTCTWVFNTSNVFVQVYRYETDPKDVMLFSTGSGDPITNLTGKADETVIVYMGSADNASIHFTASPKKSEKNRRFQMNYFKECDQMFESNTGYFRSPRYRYDAKDGPVNCSYTFEMDKPGHYRVPVVTFMDIKLGNDSVVGHSKRSVVGKCKESSTHCMDFLGINKKLVINTGLSSNGSHFEGIFMQNAGNCTGIKRISKTGAKVKVFLDNTFRETNFMCRTLVQGPPGHSLQIHFDNVDIRSVYDVLEIHDGDSRQDPPLWRYKHDGVHTDVLTSGSAAWIQFSKDETESHPSYHLTITSLVYGGAMKDNGTIILGPKSQIADLQGKTEAHYQLSVVPGSQVVLSVEEFVPAAKSDYIEIYEFFAKDEGWLIQRISGSMSQNVLFTMSNQMLLVISGDLTKLKFNASFDFPQSQHVEYSRATSGGFYSENENGKFLILPRNPVSDVLALTLNLNLPSPAYVTITDGSTSVVFNSTGHHAAPVLYFHPNVTLEYTPDAIFGGESWISAHYDVINAVDVNMNGSHGLVSSPYYPNQYPYNAKCKWTFTQPAGQSLHMAFKNFHLTNNHTLTLWEDTKNRSKIATYRGDDLPEDVIISKKVQLEFSSVSQSSVPLVAQGFEAVYGRSACNAMYAAQDGTMQTTGFPKPVGDSTCCVWIIKLPSPKPKGSVNIVSFTYEINGLKNGSTSRVQFRDGASMSSMDFPVNLTEGTSGTILSRTGKLWIHYSYNKSNKVQQGYAFRLNYTTHTCNKVQLCDNGICMHSDWKCDGHDNCGDGSDERNCTETVENGVSMTTLALAIVFTFIGTVLLTVFVPLIYRRLRRRNAPYDSLQEVMSPSDE